MVVNDIFTIEPGILSVIYEGERLNEFERLFELWNDPAFLFTFFQANIKLLHEAKHNGKLIWPNISIEDAVEITLEDAAEMEECFYEKARAGEITRSKDNLAEFFKPLSKGVYEMKLGKNKAKGLREASWLRIYAIQLQPNLFVISGGCIKLTRVMPILEYDKLGITKRYIEENYVE